jgi:hypothetical protein
MKDYSLFKIWKIAEPYIQTYLDWYQLQPKDKPLAECEQKCCH